jgi:2-keto-4-pentenoate hydratase
MDQSAVNEVAKRLVRARQTGERLDRLPAQLKPRDFVDSCAVMDAVDRLVGDRIAGTKIAAKPGTEVVYAPLHAARMFDSPARVPRALVPGCTMECEISFRLPVVGTKTSMARPVPCTEVWLVLAVLGRQLNPP